MRQATARPTGPCDPPGVSTRAVTHAVLAAALATWVAAAAGCFDDTVGAECQGANCVCSGGDAVCELSCAPDEPCTTTCDDDAGCTVDCAGAPACAVTCGDPSWCDVDCRGGPCEVSCASRCTVTRCTTGPCTVSCGSDATPTRVGDTVTCPFRS